MTYWYIGILKPERWFVWQIRLRDMMVHLKGGFVQQVRVKSGT